MSWKFWERRKEAATNQSLKILVEQISLINKKFNLIEEHFQDHSDRLKNMDQSIDSNEDLIQKSLRLQYKSYQETLKILEQTNNIFNKISEDDKMYIEIEKENNILTREKEYMLEKYILWLDDIDLIYDNLNEEGQEYWVGLLENWQKQISKSLEVVGVYEVDILGKTFNSAIAEAVSTRKREDNKDDIPYQVVNVLQRGYMFKDGTLLRKAKVITIEEEGNYKNEEG